MHTLNPPTNCQPHPLSIYKTRLPGSFSKYPLTLPKNTLALSASSTGTFKLITFGPTAAIPADGGSDFFTGAAGVVPARMSMMSSSAGGEESTKDADGSAVTCGVNDPRVAL